MLVREHRATELPDPRQVEAPAYERVVVERRTCTHCGSYARFDPVDATGGWYRCSRCGAEA
jgi:ribosomal protein S27AE